MNTWIKFKIYDLRMAYLELVIAMSARVNRYAMRNIERLRDDLAKEYELL